MNRPEPRRFLFLQGPPGPFFADLAQGLRDAGHHCARINQCGGDQVDWRGPAHDFTGRSGDWPAYLGAVIAQERISDIVLFGDCRPAHREARALADRCGIVTHVFEEGYVRPDWVTLERGGVNGYSSLPRQPDQFLALAAHLPPAPDHPPLPASFARRAVEAIRHHGGSWVLTPRFPNYRSHRPDRLIAEAAGWCWRLLGRPADRLRSAAALRRLRGRRYFVLPLQLDADHQIRVHSGFAGMAEAVAMVIASFAAHAPADTLLLIKEHPLDNGLRPWRRLVRHAAARHRVARRVVFIQDGPIDALVARSAGVVTVNSTTGTLALGAGIAVAVLGHAVYDLPGITHQGSLHAFWRDPGRPQPAIYEAFRRVLIARCLLRGGFSSTAGRAALLPRAIDRLTANHSSAATGAAHPSLRATAC